MKIIDYLAVVLFCGGQLLSLWGNCGRITHPIAGATGGILMVLGFWLLLLDIYLSRPK